MGLTGYLFRKIFITNLFYEILYEYGILLINAFFLEPFTNLRTFCIELRAVRTSQKCSKIAASERSLVFGTEVRTTLSATVYLCSWSLVIRIVARRDDLHSMKKGIFYYTRFKKTVVRC